MHVADQPAKFFLAPITAHNQCAVTNNEAVLYGDSAQQLGTAIMASQLGQTAISTANPAQINMGVFLQIGNGNRICLGILDNGSTQHLTSPGGKSVYNQDNTASIDLLPTGNVTITSTGTVQITTTQHQSIDLDTLTATVNALVNTVNSVLTALGTLANSAGPVAPVPPTPVLSNTPPVGAWATLVVKTTLPQP